MNKTELLAFRLTPVQREKLKMLALGEGFTMTGVIAKLIEDAPVKPVKRVVSGLALTAAMQKNSAVCLENTGAIAQ